MEYNKVKRPESAIQFEDIYNKWNDPEERKRREIKKRREERSNFIKLDSGM